MSIGLLTLVLLFEIVEISEARIKANAFFKQLYNYSSLLSFRLYIFSFHINRSSIKAYQPEKDCIFRLT